MSFLDPKKNIEQFGLDEGMVVADLGSGSGFYSLEAAKIVGSEGRVYAVDVIKDFLNRLKTTANLEKLFNLEIIWGNIEKLGGTNLANYSVDAVIVSNTLFQIEDKNTFLEEIRRILRPKGRVLVVDWTSSFGGLGPIPESVFTENQAIDLFEENGFKKEKNILAGDNHYGVIFRKK